MPGWPPSSDGCPGCLADSGPDLGRFLARHSALGRRGRLARVACKDGHSLFAIATREGETQRTRTEPTEWYVQCSVWVPYLAPLLQNLRTPTLHGQRTPRRPLNTVELYLLWYQAKENPALIMHGLSSCCLSFQWRMSGA